LFEDITKEYEVKDLEHEGIALLLALLLALLIAWLFGVIAWFDVMFSPSFLVFLFDSVFIIFVVFIVCIRYIHFDDC
jgi:membrane protein YdbS with pleckstrin-like domain